MERVKVLFIVPSLKAGGAESVIITISKHLNKLKFDVFLLVLNSNDSFFSLSDSDGVTVISYTFKKVRYSIFKIFKVIKQIQPQIIFSTITHLNILLGILKPFLFHKIKLVLRESNVLKSLFDNNFTFRKYLLFFLLKKAYNNASIILCQSAYMKNEIFKLLRVSREKLNLIYNPVNKPKLERNTTLENFDLIAIGNLIKIKGFDRMMHIMAHNLLKNYKLVIIGEGSERKNLENLIDEFNLNSQVTLLGIQRNPYDYLANAKLLLITSYFESFPNVALEAGILGLPVISFNVEGGIGEIIQEGKTGFLVDDGDNEKYVKTILKAFDTSFDKRYIQDLTYFKYGIENIISQFELLFLNLAEN